MSICVIASCTTVSRQRFRFVEGKIVELGGAVDREGHPGCQAERWRLPRPSRCMTPAAAKQPAP